MTQIPNNTSVLESTNMSLPSVSQTESPPPGYSPMSEDGDPMDPNDNLSEFCVVYNFE